MESPCTNNCKVIDNVCVGCKRHLTEIFNWAKYTDEERLDIINRINKDFKSDTN